MGNLASKKENSKDREKEVKKMWEEENKLSLNERRKRYKCKDKYIDVKNLPVWSEKVNDCIKNGEY